MLLTPNSQFPANAAANRGGKGGAIWGSSGGVAKSPLGGTLLRAQPGGDFKLGESPIGSFMPRKPLSVSIAVGPATCALGRRFERQASVDAGLAGSDRERR